MQIPSGAPRAKQERNFGTSIGAMLRATLLTWLLCRYVTRHVNQARIFTEAGTRGMYPARARARARLP